jgi:PEP-CTERM motif
MKIRTKFTVGAILFAALVLAPLSASAVTIDFNTLAGANGSTFTSYSESNYTVASTTGTWDVSNSGVGDPAPDIYSHSGTITVTRPDPPATSPDFDFTGVDLESTASTGGTYTIVGYLNGIQQFSTSGSLTTSFVLDGTGFSDDTLDQLVITVAGGNGDSRVSLDNIGVEGRTAPTPEPASLVLLASGLVGIGGVVRRRLVA